MDRMRFTSRLTTSDIRLFLIRYGHFYDVTFQYEFIKNETDIVCFFSCASGEYKLFCEDFEMTLMKLDNHGEQSVIESRPSQDDWFCFLKSIFGKEYLEHFATLLNARHIVYDESKFISKISYYEMVIIIRQILKENFKRLRCDYSSSSIIEVESFYRSERRFWIEDGKFYVRISDFQVVVPTLSYYVLDSYLKERFGKEFENEHRIVSKALVPLDFHEFISSEDNASACS